MKIVMIELLGIVFVVFVGFVFFVLVVFVCKKKLVILMDNLFISIVYLYIKKELNDIFVLK